MFRPQSEAVLERLGWKPETRIVRLAEGGQGLGFLGYSAVMPWRIAST
ncbi:hypothetical protein Atai01_13930 [Amycolatopsis taiwanensis]|uniref:Uncharacterized protein n=1 Tax=Amycolatopsis taiwanensis TaxID=342230 RepID=A0A9W6QV97_9PSEU|nr:hypothetical protein Atai01_13930 [Amycolatopsis taiwanensis]